MNPDLIDERTKQQITASVRVSTITAITEMAKKNDRSFSFMVDNLLTMAVRKENKKKK